MLIHIDRPLTDFEQTKYDDEHDRWFYALAEPRVLLRVDGFELSDVQTGDYVDASVGWDRGDAGYVRSENVGKRHTKITFRKRLGQLPEQFDINDKLKPLSAVLAAAPSNAARFDANAIADEVISLLTDHVSRLSHKLSIGGWLPGVASESDFVPLREEISELCRIANGEIDRNDASDEFVAETHQLLQDVAELCAWWWTAEYEIPQSWRETPLGRAWDGARFWLLSADMINLSEAARMLYDAAGPAELNKIDRAIKRGDLVEYSDPTEPNPRQARRVLKSDVRRLLKKRSR